MLSQICIKKFADKYKILSLMEFRIHGKRKLIYRHFGDDVPREQAFVVPKGEKVWTGEYKIKHEILDHIRSSLFLRRIASWEVDSNVICQASEALSGCPEIVVYNADLVGRYITLPF